jgi:hypothetical protein
MDQMIADPRLSQPCDDVIPQPSADLQKSFVHCQQHPAPELASSRGLPAAATLSMTALCSHSRFEMCLSLAAGCPCLATAVVHTMSAHSIPKVGVSRR